MTVRRKAGVKSVEGMAAFRCRRGKAGVAGFWNLFWTGYVEMFFVNLGDFFGLDLLFRGIVKKKGLMTPFIRRWCFVTVL